NLVLYSIRILNTDLRLRRTHLSVVILAPKRPKAPLAAALRRPNAFTWSNRMDPRLDLVVEYMDPARLCPFRTNARSHRKKQILQLAHSIRTFEFIKPIIIDDYGTILAGHGSAKAAELLGMPSIPCVRLSHMTPALKRAYVIADNKLALNAGWDEELLT